jgi:predicted Rossmann fold nucleotide-binding protein DprA/Smf involved in DNA uptake
MSPSRGAAGVDLLARVSSEIDARREQLRAAVEEYQNLLSAMEALDQDGSAPRAKATPARAKAAGRPNAKPKATPRAKAEAKATPKAQAEAKAPLKAKVTAPLEVEAKPKATPKKPAKANKAPKRAESETSEPTDGAHQAIVAALEHGSHTLSELAVVTAMPAHAIRAAIKGLAKAGRVQRATREGKAAYALPD